ncbi:odorant receptor 4-like [Copidosoma floridanum]|uniref:odorant receptor 4-like n=1 Tax=Copidosoma floridanum TaxID=29053 RepID=UPI0006C94D40|nr:odorant receptor 4-like [Copidosoma floridanum]
MQLQPFVLLSLVSIWRPKKWSSSLAVTLYSLYTVVSLIVYYTFMISEILDIILLAENVQQIMENMIQLINITNVTQKSFSFLSKRKKIIRFIDMFFDDVALPQTPEEEAIQKKFDDESRSNTHKLAGLYSISVFTFVYMPYFVSDIEDRVLPYRGWLPYSLDSVRNYRIAYLHQAWAVTIAASVNASTEVLVSGFMIQICAQFRILEERFARLTQTVKAMRDGGIDEGLVFAEEKKLLVKLIQHHLKIFEMAELLNDIYVFVILFQFAASIVVLCVCTYNLALCPSVNSDFVTIFLFQSCMLLQIFLYTWYGNEITLRSTDLGNNILLTDWRHLSQTGIKNLMIIYQRTTKPIIMSSGYVITLSNVAFTSIVKTSYSVYNVLSV